MGVLNLRKETYHQQKIATFLQRRGMTPDTHEDWEVHGPHEGMNYQVYVGYAIAKEDPSESFPVAIYPRAVYEIDSPSDWARVSAEKRILIDE